MVVWSFWRAGCTYQGVCFAGIDTAGGRGTRPPEKDRNSRLIIELAGWTAGAKKGQFFHRHSQGEKVKGIVPGSE